MGASESLDVDPFDVERLRLTPDMVGEFLVRPRPPRHHHGEAFLRGPIPYLWICSACQLPGVGLHVALTYRFLRGRFPRWRDRQWDLDTIAKGLRVSDDSVRRGLVSAESSGLISVIRKPGCKILASDVSILDPAKSESDQLPLRGPTPWTWLRPALWLPVAGLRVALACWLRAGWDRSGEFELVLGEWSELGLSRFSAGRGLATLEEAGLVVVVRRPGLPPVVTLCDMGAIPSGESTRA